MKFEALCFTVSLMHHFLTMWRCPWLSASRSVDLVRQWSKVGTVLS